ncbi:hypothetical protein Plhal304r1_c010g0040181 [Plasmopara halstedii]
MRLFTARKDAKRTWPEHYLYLVAVSDACEGAGAQVLDNIVHYATSELRTVLMAKYDARLFDFSFKRKISRISHSLLRLIRGVLLRLGKTSLRTSSRANHASRHKRGLDAARLATFWLLVPMRRRKGMMVPRVAERERQNEGRGKLYLVRTR